MKIGTALDFVARGDEVSGYTRSVRILLHAGIYGRVGVKSSAQDIASSGFAFRERCLNYGGLMGAGV